MQEFKSPETKFNNHVSIMLNFNISYLQTAFVTVVLVVIHKPEPIFGVFFLFMHSVACAMWRLLVCFVTCQGRNISCNISSKKLNKKHQKLEWICILETSWFFSFYKRTGQQVELIQKNK